MFGLRSACCYGGGNMHDQQKALSEGCEVMGRSWSAFVFVISCVSTSDAGTPGKDVIFAAQVVVTCQVNSAETKPHFKI